jgi:hypothetical protein
MPLEGKKICTKDYYLKSQTAKKKAGKGKTKLKTKKQILNKLTTLNKPSTSKTEILALFFNKPYFNRKKVIEWMDKHYRDACYKIGETKNAWEAKIADITKKQEKEMFREYRNMVTKSGVRMLIGIRKYAPRLKETKKLSKSKTKKQTKKRKNKNQSRK